MTEIQVCWLELEGKVFGWSLSEYSYNLLSRLEETYKISHCMAKAILGNGLDRSRLCLEGYGRVTCRICLRVELTLNFSYSIVQKTMR